jgi:arylsulfatase A-like enzyme
MKKYLLLLPLLLHYVLINAQQLRPNIIVFLVDDMGWMDTSVPFGDSAMALNKRYHTPNMEKLAAQGMKFTNAYAAPVCTPSRVSMLTGMNAAHHGVTNWTSPVKNMTSDEPDAQMNEPGWNNAGLSPVPSIPHTCYATPFPRLLKDAGYFTIHVGKAHWAVAGTPGASPYNMGFLVNVAGHAGGHPQSYLAKDNYGNMPGKWQIQAVPDLEEYYGTDTFLTEALTLEAIKALEEPIRKKQPFYLNFAQYAVHMPIMGDKRFVQKYYDSGLDSIEARYASLIEGMDKSLGDIMRFLQQKGVDKNTIILFMSDNGGLSEHARGGAPNTHNLPLKSGKGSVYEGGIREPMIVRWPGMVKPGTVANQYVIIEDFFPTILQMAGLTNYNTVQQVDGKSFLPILKNAGYVDTSRALFWHYPHKWIPRDGPGINYCSAVRQGSWKLVYNMRTGHKELYNLKTDMSEQNDLAALHPEIVTRLANLLAQQLKTFKAPMPTLKTTGKPVPWPDER